VDASGLETVGLGANGIVAILGTSEGGVPVTAQEEAQDLTRINRPEAVKTTYRSGDLREAGAMAFDPSRDPDIPGGAVEIVGLKVNPATRSSATFGNINGDTLDLSSRDYGAFTAQYNVEIADGTTKGKRVTVRFEDVLEIIDDAGGDALFTLKYKEPTGVQAPGWDLMTLDVLAGGHRANATRTELGKDTDIAAVGTTVGASIVSSNAGDTTQQVTVYGLVGGTPTRETKTLNGVTPVALSSAFDVAGIFACEMDSAAVGTVDIRDGTPTVILQMAPAALERGGVRSSAMFLDSELINFVLDAAGVHNIWFVGVNAAGQNTIERIASNGTTSVPTAVIDWVQIDYIVLSELPAARTLTMTGIAVETSNAAQTTITKIVDYFNARQVANIAVPNDPFGFQATLQTGQLQFLATNIDLTSAPINIDDPVTASIYGDLFFLVSAINSQSGLISAAVASGAVGMPPADDVVDNTTQPVFLTGGSEGIATQTEWTKAFNLLKKIRVNSVVVLTGDPSIHALLVAHCDFMAGPLGRAERDGAVGIQDTATQSTFPTKQEYKDAIVNLNTRHIRAFGQEPERFDTGGERVFFPTYFSGVLALGQQAGSGVGISLTHKLTNALSFRQSNTWNPIDDAEEMIQAGAMFAKDIEGLGRRWERNVTTHLSSSNIAFTEASVNEAVNYSVLNFRDAMEISVGKPGFSGTINAAKAVALRILGLLVDNQVLTAFQALKLQLDVDVLSVDVEISPIIPINFVASTIHLVTIRQTA
jgi:hypothetical protein